MCTQSRSHHCAYSSRYESNVAIAALVVASSSESDVEPSGAASCEAEAIAAGCKCQTRVAGMC